jgi:hypothetical protein
VDISPRVWQVTILAMFSNSLKIEPYGTLGRDEGNETYFIQTCACYLKAKDSLIYMSVNRRMLGSLLYRRVSHQGVRPTDSL